MSAEGKGKGVSGAAPMTQKFRGAMDEELVSLHLFGSWAIAAKLLKFTATHDNLEYCCIGISDNSDNFKAFASS